MDMQTARCFLQDTLATTLVLALGGCGPAKALHSTPRTTEAAASSAARPATPAAVPEPTEQDDEATQRALHAQIQNAACFDEPLIRLAVRKWPTKERSLSADEQAEMVRLEATLGEPKASAKDRQQALFLLARLHYTVENWPRAARLFFEYASVAGAENSMAAVELYASAAITMAHSFGRSRCEAHLFDHVEALHAAHCSRRPGQSRPDCATLDGMLTSIELARIQASVARADEAHDIEALRPPAEEYLVFLAKYCGPNPTIGFNRCDEIAYNAGAIFMLTQQRERALGILNYFDDPRNRLQHSDLARRFRCVYDGRPVTECEAH